MEEENNDISYFDRCQYYNEEFKSEDETFCAIMNSLFYILYSFNDRQLLIHSIIVTITGPIYLWMTLLNDA